MQNKEEKRTITGYYNNCTYVQKNVKKNKKIPKKRPQNLFSLFLEKRPLLAYLTLTFALMFSVFLVEQGGRFYQASILNIPAFNGTSVPIEKVPNWVKTGGRNDKTYSEYSQSDFIFLPEYNASRLLSECNNGSSAYGNSCGTYSTVYMGNYRLDHTEYAGSHLATDIRAPHGTPVFAIANALVEKAKYQSTGFGNHIVLRHPNVPLLNGEKDTLYSSYSHLSSLVVSEGDVVERGQLIGYVGSTGTSTTPHVHFQIDRSSAPYHPWWPFSSAQASAVGLSFFSGVNAGLGQKEAIKNTVNPMEWVQEFLRGAPDSSSVKDTPPSAVSINSTSTPPSSENASPAALKRFSVIANLDEVDMEEPLVFIITAYDATGKRMTDYSGENINITPSTTNATLGNIFFEEGRATVFITFHEYGRMGITIRDGNISNTVRVKVLNTVATDVEDKIENMNQNSFSKDVVSASLEAKNETIMSGKRTTITVSLFDEDGEIIMNPDFQDALGVRVEGEGRVEPKKILARYFDDKGEAKVNFYADDIAGESQVFLEQFPGQKESITVLEKVEPVSGFIVESNGFIIGKPVDIFITSVDTNQDKTLRSFSGNVNLEVTSGKAKLSKKILTSKDFVDGVATVQMTSLSKTAITVRAKSGVLLGESKLIREARKTEKIFHDISVDHPNADAISYLKKKEILSGNPDGSFRPNGGINRAEFAKVILLSLDIDPVPAKGNRFSDVSKNEWFAGYVETAANLGVINGYPDGSFRPAGNINRAEMFAMLARASKVALPKNSSFVDVPNTEWYASSAAYAQNNNLLDFGTQFYPASLMSRAEVAEAVSRFLHL